MKKMTDANKLFFNCETCQSQHHNQQPQHNKMSLSKLATEVTQEYATAMEEATESTTKAEPHDPVRWFFQHASPYRKTFCEGCFEEKSNVRWYTESYNAERMPAWENSTVAKAQSACKSCQTMMPETHKDAINNDAWESGTWCY